MRKLIYLSMLGIIGFLLGMDFLEQLPPDFLTRALYVLGFGTIVLTVNLEQAEGRLTYMKVMVEQQAIIIRSQGADSAFVAEMEDIRDQLAQLDKELSKEEKE